MNSRYQDQLRRLLSDRALTARDILTDLGISQPTLSRLIGSMPAEIVVMGKGRSTSYGLVRNPDRFSKDLPVYRIDSKGVAHLFGRLTPLKGGQYWWQPTTAAGELYPQLPWFLLDLLLNGYSARKFAQEQATQLNLSPRLIDWTEDDMLYAASRRGEDRPGNLLLGEESLSRYQNGCADATPIMQTEVRPLEYPQFALKASVQEISPAGLSGEQPKFSANINERDAVSRILVKFSPATESKEARRYADLLVCEHLALETLRMCGYNSARSRLTIVGNQTFLSLKRFDRRGALGRLPCISLRALHARIQAPCDHWVPAADRLQQHGLLDPEDAAKLRRLARFSELIGNTNQHFGNISFLPRGRNKYLPAPFYGIRPTIYEPLAGEIPARVFTPPPPRLLDSDTAEPHRAAILFWKSAAVDDRISESFRQLCFENCEILQLQLQQAGSSANSSPAATTA